MTLSSLGAQGILTYISFKRQARLPAYLFIVAVLCMPGMSSMANDSEQNITNQWIEEIMNSIGQISFAFARWRLDITYQ